MYGFCPSPGFIITHYIIYLFNTRMDSSYFALAVQKLLLGCVYI